MPQHITYHGPHDEVSVPDFRLAEVRRLVPVEVSDEAAAALLPQVDNYRPSTPEDFEHAAQLAEREAAELTAPEQAALAAEAKRLRALGKAAAKALTQQAAADAAHSAPAGAGQEG